MDQTIVELAESYRPLAVEILREAIRIPADYVDRDPELGGDPDCGVSNHERPRLGYLRRKIVEVGAVANAADVEFDAFGNLVWQVEDREDGIPSDDKTVVYFDGHTDTVRALRPRWRQALGGGIDAFDGLTDPARVDHDVLGRELGYVPPPAEWEHLVFGRGAADQLGGVVCQIIATKIMLECRARGALRGVIVRSYGTVAEEDNDGGGAMYVMRQELPGAPPARIPDVVILTEGTGCARHGALGIYRGQRGRMQIEVEVIGKSCHGSMPWEGKNPLEWSGAILSEAAARHTRGEGFLDHAFLGRGSRTASMATLETPSDCAVPERFTFRFDRRLTLGETPDAAVEDVESMESVSRARAAGLGVDIRVPTYREPTWTGYVPGNPQIYAGWITPEEHPAIQGAADAYRRVASPIIEKLAGRRDGGGAMRTEPRISRWIFSTDGVGYPLPEAGASIQVAATKTWVSASGFTHPAMFGFGPGIEQNTHKIGECVDARELGPAIAVLARFPSLYRQLR